MASRRPRSTRAARPEVQALRARPSCDVLVIGGGINGVATFRDLAMQGVDVALVERGDIAGETSAASSRMIHGGLRYLENGEFRLVREAVAERNDLLSTAPHHVHPLATTIPLRHTWSGLASAPLRFLAGRGPQRRHERGAALVIAGLKIYDSYSRVGRAQDGTAVPRHRIVGREDTFAELPDLHPETRMSATYWDAAVWAPERLALEVALDALAAESRARLATYAEAVGVPEPGVVTVRDTLTGEEIPLRPRVVVNAAGPFVDLVHGALGEQTSHVGGSKGSHIVVDSPALHAACRGREIFFENDDGRIVLVYPQHGRVILGTTDIPASPLEPARCTEGEVDYFIELAARVFPGIPVRREQIVYRYAGIRPLPRDDAADPGRVSRDYRVVESALPGGVPLLSVVGGKWTTFRALGESVADAVLPILGRARVASTRGAAIGGGRGFPSADDRPAWIAEHMPGLTVERADTLLTRYGTRAERIARAERGRWADNTDSVLGWLGWAGERITHGTPLKHAPEYTREEIRWICRHERVVRLEDLVLRRTTLAFEGRISGALLVELADVVGDALGWRGRRRREEVAAVRDVLREAHGVDLGARALPV
ncbi:glycerol-3-phosphate dehydrogenase/oxidase [Demequina pelophila]|uniref:glycerol-3-phosphate dehydrogenase/oxidase n=1 Tax=Demequina pelophila TaxID=1638984 RepID=UPI000781AD32|nr:glycerol-3-phosphate dehydrogenase/oxidase [Demequina pelophila]